jgi:DNA polymerase IV
MERKIVHFDIPNFYAALEELRRPELKKRPLVLAEPRPRALLQGINGIARAEGLREGMELSRARRFCRRLEVIPPDYRFYRGEHQRILNVLDHFSPLVEGTLQGHYFVDVSGTRRLWGPATDAAYRMEKELAERRSILASAGVAHNKLVSRVAAQVIPPGDLSFVFPGGEASFLSPLPVNFLPGVGPKTSSLLDDFNIRSIGELAAIPGDSLSTVFGGTAPRLVQLARGVDSTPVIPSRKPPGISVSRILDRDEIDRERLEGLLLQQVEEGAWTLRRCNRYAGAFSLEIRYADGLSVEGRKSLPVPPANVDRRLFQAVRDLFVQVFTRRVAVRRITLEFRKLIMPPRQLSLFAMDEEDERLQGAIDAIRGRFGGEAVSWGRAVMARAAAS